MGISIGSVLESFFSTVCVEEDVPSAGLEGGNVVLWVQDFSWVQAVLTRRDWKLLVPRGCPIAQPHFVLPRFISLSLAPPRTSGQDWSAGSEVVCICQRTDSLPGQPTGNLLSEEYLFRGRPIFTHLFVHFF